MIRVELANQHNKVLLHKVEHGPDPKVYALALQARGTSAAKGLVELWVNEAPTGLAVAAEQNEEDDNWVELELNSGDVIEAYVTGSASADLKFVLDPVPPAPKEVEWVDPELTEVQPEQVPVQQEPKQDE